MLWHRLLLSAGQMSVKTSWVRVLLGPGFLRPLFSPDAGWSGCPVEVSACCNQLSYRLSYHGARHTARGGSGSSRTWVVLNKGPALASAPAHAPKRAAPMPFSAQAQWY